MIVIYRHFGGTFCLHLQHRISRPGNKVQENVTKKNRDWGRAKGSRWALKERQITVGAVEAQVEMHEKGENKIFRFKTEEETLGHVKTKTQRGCR